MNRIRVYAGLAKASLVALLLLVFPAGSILAQQFDFDRLTKEIQSYTVIVKLKIELSMGMQTNEHEQRLLGTIVTEDGMVIFDGGSLSIHDPFSPMPGLSFKTTPTKIEVNTLDSESFEAEFIGVDPFTRIAFARIVAPDGRRFEPVEFTLGQEFKTGEWLALFMLLPEYVKPPLAGDVGMVSCQIEAPEAFTLTMGFSTIEMTSVLFDGRLNPVGVLGELSDPASINGDAGSFMIESFDQFELPLLGVVTGEKLAELIAHPPERGKIDRAWLGITLQALTDDIAEFLGVDVPGGIIVNDVVKGSPAEECGLEIGDVIFEVNSQPLDIRREEEVPVFQRRIAMMGAGTSVEFTVLRSHEDELDTLKLLAHLKAAPLSATEAAEFEDKQLEFKVRDIVFSDYMFYNVEQGEISGVVVSELQRGGLAHIAGLALGDVIQRVGSVEIASVDDFSAAMTELELNSPPEIVFFVWRMGKTMFINIRTS